MQLRELSQSKGEWVRPDNTVRLITVFLLAYTATL